MTHPIAATIVLLFAAILVPSTRACKLFLGGNKK